MSQTEPSAPIKSFKELVPTKKEIRVLTGDRIAIRKLLDKEITVLWYKFENTKLENATNEKCLYLQIMFKGEKRVTWTSSKYLMVAIIEIPNDQPFTTTITEIDQRFEFS